MKTKQHFIHLLLVFIVPLAAADIIRIEVTGHVTQDPFGSYDNQPGQYPLVNVGDTMTGYCIYDTSHPDQEPSDLEGRYPLDTITMQVGAYTFKNGSHTMNNPYLGVGTFDEFYRAICPSDIDIYINSVLETWSGQMTLLEIGNATHGRPDDTFPTFFPEDLSTYYPARRFYLSGNFINISGEIDSAQVIVVPEPATVLLLAFGGLFLSKRT